MRTRLVLTVKRRADIAWCADTTALSKEVKEAGTRDERLARVSPTLPAGTTQLRGYDPATLTTPPHYQRMSDLPGGIFAYVVREPDAELREVGVRGIPAFRTVVTNDVPAPKKHKRSHVYT